MLRSRHTIPLLVIAIVIGAITSAAAIFIDWLPEQASEQADRVDHLMWFVVWSSVAIFTLVATVILYAAIRFRAKPGDESDGPPTHGNTTLEVVWTIVPTILLAVVAVWAYLVLSDNEALAKRPGDHQRHRPAVRVGVLLPRRADRLGRPPRPGEQARSS